MVDKVLTPEFRVSFPEVFQARAMEAGQEPKYSITMLFPKGCDLSALKKAAAEVLVDCYAQEVRNISKLRVAIVDPGATRTQMRARAYPGEDPMTVKTPDMVAERIVALLEEPFASPHRERIGG